MALSTAAQRTLLKGFIVSIAVSGLVGIYALLAGDRGCSICAGLTGRNSSGDDSA